MDKEKKLISLKEASELSGYSSDYIGQLIRSGKIFGEQVYSNVVWKTTEEAVLSYKNKSKSSKKELELNSGFFNSLRKRFLIEINILKIFLNTFRLAFILIITLLVAVIILTSYIFLSLNSLERSGGLNEKPGPSNHIPSF